MELSNYANIFVLWKITTHYIIGFKKTENSLNHFSFKITLPAIGFLTGICLNTHFVLMCTKTKYTVPSTKQEIVFWKAK